MKLAATKTLTNELNKKLQEVEKTSIYLFWWCNYSEAEYKCYVDIDTYYHENDYNINSDTFRTIKIIYKDDCYSGDNYITTNDLIRLLKHCENKTLDELFTEILNEYEI